MPGTALNTEDSKVTDGNKKDFAKKMIHLYHRGMMNSGFLALIYVMLTAMFVSQGSYVFGAIGLVCSFFCSKDAIDFYNYRKIAKEVYGG